MLLDASTTCEKKNSDHSINTSIFRYLLHIFVLLFSKSSASDIFCAEMGLKYLKEKGSIWKDLAKLGNYSIQNKLPWWGSGRPSASGAGGQLQHYN